MKVSFQILVYGRDPMLLKTRLWLLQGAGYTVFTASGLQQVQEAFDSGRIDLLVLCHSLSPHDAEAATQVARSADSPTCLMQIDPFGATYVPDHSKYVVSAAAGPKALLKAVQGMYTQANRAGT